NQPDRAIASYSRVIEMAPMDPRGYYARAAVYNNNQHTAEAEKDLAKAAELDPTGSLRPNRPAPKPPTRRANQLGDSEFAEFDELIADEKYSDALASINAVLSNDPKNAHALLKRAHANDKLGNAANAMKDVNGALKLEPNNVEALLFRASLL